MECNGICHDNEAAYFKITCSGVDLPQKLKILKDGSANKEYKDICQDPQHSAQIAYYNAKSILEVDETGNMVENLAPPKTGDYKISEDYEILESFFNNYHVLPTWLDSNDTPGWFDEETGHWTGALGKVVFFKLCIKMTILIIYRVVIIFQIRNIKNSDQKYIRSHQLLDIFKSIFLCYPS